jgi:hypothetical protein
MELSPLDRALRAARRGHTVAARELLDGVLAAEPDHEEALLWRARVAAGDAEREAFLQRVVAVNPQNRWAADQLASGGDGAAAAGGAPAGARGPAPDTLQCPNCGGSVEIHPERGAKAVACTYCGSVLDLTTRQVDILGQMDPKVKPAHPIEPGDEGTFFGENHLVIGWLRYEGWDDEDRWQWDEWQLVSDSGTARYLSWYSGDGWTLQTPVRPTPKVTRGGIKLKEGTARATEVGPAKIVAMRGELTWRPKLGQTLKVMEARRGGQHYSAELTADEIEVSGGPRVPERAIWEAFGREDKLREMAERAERRRQRRKSLRRAALVCFAFAVLYFFGIGWAASKGESVSSGSTTFVAQERDLPAPPPLADNRAVVRERTEITTIDVRSPGETYEVSLESRPTDGTGHARGDLYLQAPGGDTYELGRFSGARASDTYTFKPTASGAHVLVAYVQNRSPERVTFTTEVRKGMWEPGPFGLAMFASFLLGAVLFLAGGFGRIE